MQCCSTDLVVQVSAAVTEDVYKSIVRQCIVGKSARFFTLHAVLIFKMSGHIFVSCKSVIVAVALALFVLVSFSDKGNFVLCRIYY